MATPQEVFDALTRLTESIDALREAQEKPRTGGGQQGEKKGGGPVSHIRELMDAVKGGNPAEHYWQKAVNWSWNKLEKGISGKAKKLLPKGKPNPQSHPKQPTNTPKSQSGTPKPTPGMNLKGKPPAGGGPKPVPKPTPTPTPTPKGPPAGAAGAMGAAAGPVAILILAVEALRVFKKHIEQTTDELVRAQQKLAEVSPSMAAVMAQREMREIQRDIKKGEALASSAKELTDAEQRRKDATMPFENAMDKLWNKVYAFGNDMITGFTKNGVLQKLEKWLDDKDAQEKQNAAMLEATLEKEVTAELARKRDAKDRIKNLEERVGPIKK